VGWLYKRVSTRSGIIFASLLAVLTTASYGLFTGFIPLLIVRCVWGLAWTFFRLGAYITIIDCSNDSNRGHCMGTYNGLFRLGSLAGMLAGGFLADFTGLRNTALIFSGVMLFAVPAAFFGVPRAKDADTIKKEAKNDSNIVIWKDPGILWALATGMLVAMIYQGMFTATLSYLVQAHNAPIISLFGFMIGAASLAGILQAMRWGWEPWLAPWIGRTSDGKNGRRSILIVSLILGGLLFMLTPLGIPLEPWLLVLIGLQLTATALTTLADASASDEASRSSKVVVMTAYSLAIDLGAAVGPFTGYLLNSAVGTYASYWAASTVLILVAAGWFFYHPSRLTSQNACRY
jgi:MFS family permease